MNAAGLALIDPVFELVSELREACRQQADDHQAARARVGAIAREITGFEFVEELDWYEATVDLEWEGNAARERGELQQFLDEVEIARDRFDDQWQRLCDEPADETEP